MSGNALPEDYEEMWRKEAEREAIARLTINAVCACGNVRSVQVPPGDFEPKRITEEPCTCGRFMCVVGVETGTHTPIDLMLD